MSGRGAWLLPVERRDMTFAIRTVAILQLPSETHIDYFHHSICADPVRATGRPHTCCPEGLLVRQTSPFPETSETDHVCRLPDFSFLPRCPISFGMASRGQCNDHRRSYVVRDAQRPNGCK